MDLGYRDNVDTVIQAFCIRFTRCVNGAEMTTAVRSMQQVNDDWEICPQKNAVINVSTKLI